LKRAPFLTSAAALFLAGCGHHVMQALPGVAPSSKSNAFAGASSSPADRIPDNVLNGPIIGEIRRFDGTVPPNGRWMLAQGQDLTVTANRQLFSILGYMAGGDRKTAFKLPKPALNYIIAVAGIFPTSPEMLLQTGRKIRKHEDSLGDGARMPMLRIRAERAGVREAQLLAQRAPRFGPARWTPLSGAMQDRIAAADRDARTDALARLGPANRNAVAAVTDAVAAGRMSLVSAVQAMSRSLNGTEAAALLDVNDRMFAAFRSGWSGAAHPDPQLEAARFLISVAFTPEQLRAVRAQ
jgi:hypothetical protein